MPTGFFFAFGLVYNVDMPRYSHASMGYAQLSDLLGIKPESLRQRVWRENFIAPDSHGQWSAKSIADLSHQGFLPDNVIAPPHWSPRGEDAQYLGGVRIPFTSAVAGVFGVAGSQIALISGVVAHDLRIRRFLAASSIDIAYLLREGSNDIGYLVGEGSRLPPCAPSVDAHSPALEVALDSLLGTSEGDIGRFFRSSRAEALAWPAELPFAIGSTPSLDHGLALLEPYLDDDRLIDLAAAEEAPVVMDALEVVESAPDIAGADSIIRKTAREALGESQTDFRATFDGYRLSQAHRLDWTALEGSSAHVLIAGDVTYVHPGRSVDSKACDIETLTLPDPGREVAYFTTKSGHALPIPRLGIEPARSGIDSPAAAEFAASVLSLITDNPDVRVLVDSEATTIMSTGSASIIEVIPSHSPLPFGRGCQLSPTFTPEEAAEEFDRCGIDVERFRT